MENTKAIEIVDELLKSPKISANAVALYIHKKLSEETNLDITLKNQILHYLLGKEKRWPVEVGMLLAEDWCSEKALLHNVLKWIQSSRGQKMVEKHEGITISAKQILAQKEKSN